MAELKVSEALKKRLFPTPPPVDTSSPRGAGADAGREPTPPTPPPPPPPPPPTPPAGTQPKPQAGGEPGRCSISGQLDTEAMGYWLVFDYDKRLVEAIKCDIPGFCRHYDPDSKRWWVSRSAWPFFRELFPGTCETPGRCDMLPPEHRRGLGKQPPSGPVFRAWAALMKHPGACPLCGSVDRWYLPDGVSRCSRCYPPVRLSIVGLEIGLATLCQVENGA